MYTNQPQPLNGGLPESDWITENYKTKSAAIRYLLSRGFAVKVVAKHLGVKYQFVRNVATNPLKRGPNEDWRPLAERPLAVPMFLGVPGLPPKA